MTASIDLGAVLAPMSAPALLLRLARAGIALRVVDGRLAHRAPAGCSAVLLRELRDGERELLRLLAGPCPPSPSSWRAAMASWTDADHAMAIELEAALVAAGAENAAVRAGVATIAAAEEQGA